MRHIVVLFACLLLGLLAAGCGPTLTDAEKTAPPPKGPRGEAYQGPPPGANGGSAPGGAPMNSGMPPGANGPGMR